MGITNSRPVTSLPLGQLDTIASSHATVLYVFACWLCQVGLWCRVGMGGDLTVGSFIERVLVLETSGSLAVLADVDAELEHAASRVDITVEGLPASWAIPNSVYSLLRRPPLGFLAIDPLLELLMRMGRFLNLLRIKCTERASL